MQCVGISDKRNDRERCSRRKAPRHGDEREPDTLFTGGAFLLRANPRDHQPRKSRAGIGRAFSDGEQTSAGSSEIERGVASRAGLEMLRQLRGFRASKFTREMVLEERFEFRASRTLEIFNHRI